MLTQGFPYVKTTSSTRDLPRAFNSLHLVWRVFLEARRIWARMSVPASPPYNRFKGAEGSRDNISTMWRCGEQTSPSTPTLHRKWEAAVTAGTIKDHTDPLALGTQLYGVGVILH